MSAAKAVGLALILPPATVPDTHPVAQAQKVLRAAMNPPKTNTREKK